MLKTFWGQFSSFISFKQTTCKNFAKTETYWVFKVKLLTSEYWKCENITGSSQSLSAVEPLRGTGETKLIRFIPCSWSKNDRYNKYNLLWRTFTPRTITVMIPMELCEAERETFVGTQRTHIRLQIYPRKDFDHLCRKRKRLLNVSTLLFLN